VTARGPVFGEAFAFGDGLAKKKKIRPFFTESLASSETLGIFYA